MKPDHTPFSEAISSLPPDGGAEFNRLIHEKSPYLLQHARNPVDWYPWGEEAREKAQAENKPIFLSVGYSTCHWCHVMAHESFENSEVANLLNQSFVSIKVDREERPEIDEFYLNATQLLTGRGGWPNSVWLTPAGKPFYAGTYFPREDRPGMMGFKSILKNISRIWNTRRAEVESQAERVMAELRRMAGGAASGKGPEPDRTLVAGAIAALRRSFDAEGGGFGGAPKFPPHASLALLFYEYHRTQGPELLKMFTLTLKQMAQGGIHDQIGGGFHRYSTDARWFLPHFEKMLHDNALLARAYVAGYRLTGDIDFQQTAIDTYEWVLREMTAGDGGFYSALDADSEGVEGKFYLWREAEITEVLGRKTGDSICRTYGVEAKGNFREEATGRRNGTNIFYLPLPLSEVARRQKLELEELRGGWKKALLLLRQRRDLRTRPHRDDKILTDWNGLMLGSLAFGGRHLNEPRYLRAAEKAAGFILSRMRKDGQLFHAFRDGSGRLPAYLDDHAFLAAGLLDLYEATEEERWLREARSLMEVMLSRFWDEKGGGFFFNLPDGNRLLPRLKIPHDKAVPSGNGIAAQVLIRLGELTGEESYRQRARECLRAFRSPMERAPAGSESLILALARFLDGAAVSESGAKALARKKQGPVEIAVFPSGQKGPGEELRLRLRLTIDPGWQINSPTPFQDHLVPTRVELEQQPEWKLAKISYPPGREADSTFSPEPLSVYAGQLEIELLLKALSPPELLPDVLKLQISFQPCNNVSCGLKETMVLVIPFRPAPPLKFL